MTEIEKDDQRLITIQDTIWERITSDPVYESYSEVAAGQTVKTKPQQRVMRYDNLTISGMLEVVFNGNMSSDDYNLIIVDNDLVIRDGGSIVTNQNLAIRARRFKSEQGEITVGAEGVPEPGESFYKRALDGRNGPNPGRKGHKGDDASLKYSAREGGEGVKGDSGTDGMDGENGGDGRHGLHSGNLSIVVDKFHPDTELQITAYGGRGGDGGRGQDGGHGGSGNKGGMGGDGGDSNLPRGAARGGKAGEGGDAGKGGDAGRGGRPGNGGDGGEISIAYRTKGSRPFLVTAFNRGGAAGNPGQHGAPGIPGTPGEPGERGFGGKGRYGHSDGERGEPNRRGLSKAKGASYETPIGPGEPGENGNPNVGAKYKKDPAIWPFATVLSEEELQEVFDAYL
ncbi:collagen-like triple helix repeat-containing protein [Leisingera sp. S232]|uniref:collagen-like triple helix repeat-containing protein n=1 Tax=Leisingera sp. S232 TaxID=3415132 RepID=UPI003C7ECA96